MISIQQTFREEAHEVANAYWHASALDRSKARRIYKLAVMLDCDKPLTKGNDIIATLEEAKQKLQYLIQRDPCKPEANDHSYNLRRCSDIVDSNIDWVHSKVWEA